MADTKNPFEAFGGRVLEEPAAPAAPADPFAAFGGRVIKEEPVSVAPVTASANEQLLLDEAKKAGLEGKELAAFMAQTAHESHDFKTMKEYGGGKPSYSGGQRYLGHGSSQIWCKNLRKPRWDDLVFVQSHYLLF